MDANARFGYQKIHGEIQLQTPRAVGSLRREMANSIVLPFHPQESVHWNWTKLCTPQLLQQDVSRFLEAIQSWSEDPENDKQMQHFAEQGAVNASWRFLSKGISKAASLFQDNLHQARKFPASEATKYWQNEKEVAARKGRDLYTKLGLQRELTATDVFAAWHHRAHEQFLDEKYGKYRRLDREQCRKYWDNELQRARSKR